MKKLKMDSKKWIILLLTVADILLLAGILTSAIVNYFRMETITGRLAYLQDTTDIVQGDISGLQSNLEAALAEESSLIESYAIEVTDADFAAGTYEVHVSVTPKEYTDHTAVSIYFGTREYRLELNGYSYEGRVVLPMDTSFDGNVTFLLMEGEKKTTEVLRDYVGFQTGLKDVVSGIVDQEPTYREGKLHLEGNGAFSLEGNGNYAFQTFELLITANGNEIYNLDLISKNRADEDDGPGFSFSHEESSTESIGALAGTWEPVEGMEGEFALDAEAEAEAGADIRIFLKAVSEEGYTFEYELFHATTSGEEEGGFLMGTESKTPVYTVYDPKGGSLTM